VRLKGKVAVVTGGTKGLGLAIARAYAAEGATVVCASRSVPAHDPSVRPAEEELLERDQVDVREAGSVERLMERVVARHGGLDIVVANAGVSHDAKIDRLRLSAWDEMVATNLSGVFHCTRAAVPHLRRHGGGRILNVSSSMATRVAIGAAGYCATKAAVEMFTKVSAMELGRHGIIVNCLAPGILDAGMGRELMTSGAVWETYRKRFSLGRAGSVEEVARAAVFLVTEDSSYVNGHVLEVNGGLLWA